MYAEETPNPLVQKFIIGSPMVDHGQYLFSSMTGVMGIDVLEDIMALPGIESILLMSDFLSVTKTPQAPWSLLEGIILQILQHHYAVFPLQASTLEVISQGQQSGPSDLKIMDISWDDAPEGLEGKIMDLVDTYIRPGIQEDGGMITVCGFKEGVVYVRLQGACAGCPHSSLTLKHGIENTLMNYVPEATEVRLID